MENRQLITLGARNKSLSKLRASVHPEAQQTEPCHTSRVPTEPHPVPQPLRFIQTQTSKENITSSVYPSHHGPVQQVQHVPALRENYALSHQNFYVSAIQSRIVESREKPRALFMNEIVQGKSRQGSPVNVSNSRSKMVQNQSSKNLLNLTLNQNARQIQLMSKVKTLQQMLAQKDVQNQQLQSIILHQRNQNIHLTRTNSQLCKQKEENNARISELQEMLQREISKSLELMDNNESFSKNIEDTRAEILVRNTLVNALEDELKISHDKINSMQKDIEAMRNDYESKVKGLTDEISSLAKQGQVVVKGFESRLHSVQCVLLTVREALQEKSVEISSLQTMHKTELQKIAQQNQVELSQLNQTIQSQTAQISSLQVQIQQLSRSHSRSFYQKPQPQGEKGECKKCKELLQTVFRLNSHLNKK